MAAHKGQISNPTGKGGFADNPGNRSPGGWKPETTFSYQYRRFMNMTMGELDEWLRKDTGDRTVVEELAYRSVQRAKNSLPDVKEITDRTEGKPAQSVDVTTGGEAIQPVLVRFLDKADDSKDN